MSKRALIIGIDDYPGDNALIGCVKDAEGVANILGRHDDGSPNFSCQLFTTPSYNIDQPFLRGKITQLFSSEAECALFYFAGHGYESPSGGYLVTQDYGKHNEGVPFDELLKAANQALESKIIQEVVIILDCCHSGHMGNNPFSVNAGAQLAKGLSILTASMPNQLASGTRRGGLFTTTILEALSGASSDVVGNITVADVYRYADLILTAWQQRPMFKAHLKSLTVLRKSTPKVPAWIIRKLKTYFITTTAEFPLNPSFEPTHEPEHKEHEEIFSHLLTLMATGLLEPVDAEHLYFAAVHSKSCRLTALGRFYWKLVETSKI